MLNNSKLFQVFCGIFAILVIVLAAIPLVTLAFSGASNTISLDNDQNRQDIETPVSEPEINPFILSEQNIHITPGNFPLYDELTVTQRRSRELETRLPAIAPYYAEKVVYLTFDDGPDPENTPAILDTLREQQVKATFFVVGTQVEKYPNILLRTFREGHAIGNHSYNHVYRELYSSVAAYMSQLYRNDDIIRQVIGVRPRISRAPGGSAGSFTKAYWQKLKEDGYIEIGWNITSGDASSAKAEQINVNIAYQLEQRFLWNHAIVLMHDGRGHSETVKALPQIIKLFKERGFEFRIINAETPPAW